MCPLVSGVASYGESNPASASAQAPRHPQLIVANASEVVAELQKHNTLAVFQGHTHLNEVVHYRGIHYVTSGAVCGNWWHGTRWGTPEGFTVVSLRGGKIDWRYEDLRLQKRWTRRTPRAAPTKREGRRPHLPVE